MSKYCIDCGLNVNRLSFKQLNCYWCHNDRDSWPDTLVSVIQGTISISMISALMYFAYWTFTYLNGELQNRKQQQINWVNDMSSAGCKVTNYTSGRGALREIWTCPDGSAVLGRKISR